MDFTLGALVGAAVMALIGGIFVILELGEWEHLFNRAIKTAKRAQDYNRALQQISDNWKTLYRKEKEARRIDAKNAAYVTKSRDLWRRWYYFTKPLQ